jgi:TraB/PrgY/gumN family
MSAVAWRSNGFEALMNTPCTYSVVVGSGHLVGEGSVIDLLRQQGYDVRQLYPEGFAGGSSPKARSTNGEGERWNTLWCVSMSGGGY